MESLDVLQEGRIEQGAGSREQGAGSGTRRPLQAPCSPLRAFTPPRSPDGGRVPRLPRRSRPARASPPAADDPKEEIADFTRFLARQQQQQEAEAASNVPHEIPQWRRLAYRACGTDDGRRYEVRVVVAPTSPAPATTGAIELRCECLHGSVSDFVRDTAPHLIELPRKRVAVERTDRDAARQWCQNVLSQSAAAIMEADLGVDPTPAPDCTPLAAPACAPLAAPVGGYDPVEAPAVVSATV